MEFEFSHVFDAPPDRLWSVLLDPDEMAKCVPGMKSVEVLSDTEYRARIQVKIAFISAKFDVRTVISETRPPVYLRCETSGEDNSVGSSVKSVSEMFLTPQDEGGTELRVTASATVLGRLGTLGLNPMRTKAARMWEQFCQSLEAVLAGAGPDETQPDTRESAGGGTEPPKAAQTRESASAEAAALRQAEATETRSPGVLGGLRRWLGGREQIRVELSRNGTTVILHWPCAQADRCLAWLDRQLEPDGGA